MARLLLAPCVTAAQDALYNNPPSDPPCSCPTCLALPPVTAEGVPPCICSGCVPEEGPAPVLLARRRNMNPIPAKDRLRKKMRTEATTCLRAFRAKVYDSSAVTSALARAVGEDVFLP